MRARRARATAAGGMALILLTGCTSPWSGPVEQVAVTSDGFSPAALTVSAGTEVRWVNQVPGRVSVTSMETAGTEPGDGLAPTAAAVGQRFDSGPLDQGEVFALQLDEPGQYIYHSTYQDDPNWVGTITVEAP